MTAHNMSHDELIGLIYESVHDRQMLIPAMQEISRNIGAVTGHFMEMDVSIGATKTSIITDPVYALGYDEYITHYGQRDPRLGWLSSGAMGEWRTDQERYAKSFADRNEFYSDYLRKYDVRYIIGSYVGGSPEHMDTIGFLRPLGAVNYTEADFAYLRQLSPHLTRASVLRARMDDLNVQHDRDQAALAHFPYGIAWVNASLKVTFMNEVAVNMLALNDGLAIVNDRLIAYQPEEHEALNRALQLATSAQRKTGHWQTIKRVRSKLPVLVSVIPAPSRSGRAGGQGPQALVLLQDPQHRTVLNAAQFKDIFGLTTSEARLAEGLINDETLQSYSDLHGISRNTARTHLTNLFEKTGTRRQTELMRILLSVRPL